jgi:NADH:ubiquinone oxidoreductase subunit D
MLLELNRIISHLFWLATHALDVGAMSVFLFCFREREFAMDLMENYCGARLTHSAVRIGGVPVDLPTGWLEKLGSFIAKMPENILKLRCHDMHLLPILGLRPLKKYSILREAIITPLRGTPLKTQQEP